MERWYGLRSDRSFVRMIEFQQKLEISLKLVEMVDGEVGGVGTVISTARDSFLSFEST